MTRHYNKILVKGLGVLRHYSPHRGGMIVLKPEKPDNDVKNYRPISL